MPNAGFDEFLRIQRDLLLRILDAVTAAGTALALPTQASVVYDPPGPAGDELHTNGQRAR